MWSLFFILQGRAINIAMNKKNIYMELIDTLIEFVLVKMTVMFCDVFQKFIIEYHKNYFLKNQWSKKFPINIHRDNLNGKNDISMLFFDLLPNQYDLEVSIVTNRITIVIIFSLTLVVFLYNGFTLSIFALFFVFILNYLSKNIFTNQIDKFKENAFSYHIAILNWIDQYFASYKEISKNWRGIANSAWKDIIYEKYFTAKNNLVFFHLYRDLLSQILVELPFLVSTSVVIVGVYYEYISISQLFIWTGFSQFMINASNAYLDNRVKMKQRATLHCKSNAILSIFKETPVRRAELTVINKSFISEVTLRDGTKNVISLASGIYHIRGGNGSGKSTLMNMILNFDRQQHYFDNINFSEFVCTLNEENTRVIERDTIVFDCFDDFNSQICGPINIFNEQWKIKINKSISQLLDKPMANKWQRIFNSLEYEYISRRTKAMSSGEKVILSVMRFFASWNANVNLLVIDECDSFLDVDKKTLFIQTIDRLSSSMAIYICTHDSSLPMPITSLNEK